MTFLGEISDAGDARVAEVAFRGILADLPGDRSKSVFVCEILPEYEEFVRAKVALPLTLDERIFPSALAASLHVGLKGNGVASALAAARRKKPPDYRATVRGIVWNYTEDEAGS